MDWDLLLVPARVLHLGASVSLAGALVFHVVVAPLPLRRWLTPCLLLTLATAGLRLLLLAGAFTAAEGPAAALAALPEVALASRIGQALLAQAGLLLAAVALAWQLAPAAAGLALIALLAPLAASHAAAMQDPVLQAALAVHVLAGSIWLGGLLPLWRTVGMVGPEVAQRLLLRFSALGLALVALLVGTALLQAVLMAGGLPGLLGTLHGQLMLAKAALMLALLGLAALNRWVFLSRLATQLRLLRRSILAEAALGVAVLAAAGWLASVPPALHQPPVWPLPWRVLGWSWAMPAGWAALLPLGMALLLALLLTLRRRRAALLIATGIAAVGAIAVAAAGLRPEWVPATPTSFQTSPGTFSTDAILRGEALVATHAALSPLLASPPGTTEGDLFWQVGQAAAGMEEAQRWDAAQFLRAYQAGQALREEGAWASPLAAPDLALLCRHTGPTRLSALRGHVLRLAAGFAPPVSGALNINLDPTAAAGTGDCVALDGGARHAYALLAGLAAEPRLDGLWLLVDGNGWLRGSGFRTMPDILEEAALAIGAAPLSASQAHH
jgi:putative copper export protein